MGAILHAVGRKAACLLLIMCLLALTGCGMLAQQPSPWQDDAPERVTIAEVPFFAQKEYQCGPATLAMVLNWSGLKLTPEELVSEVYTPGREGSLQSALVSAARRHGRVAYPISGMDVLVTELAANHPAIVLVNLSLDFYPKWHYAVAVGYDQPASEIILHSGTIANERLSLRVFNNIFERSDYWGLLVLPPDELPATVREDAWIEAVLGLEKASQNDAAIIAYETALKRWPENFSAWIGLGNCRYRADNMSAAAKAFGQAIRLDPKSGPALNNLAYVLWKLGRRNEALNLARQAVALGGPLQEKFQKTLTEIENNPSPSSTPRPGKGLVR
ncbi:MAG: PA2778 family cysteine peptidase [Proteobacteria bacterium]|nr:PA2778 family cysteine peptidase [Pseudomonadota bacterium]MBU4296068.1 PA2778 family cysteine peptidase [Pseudomonadota bacterium]MCG2748004.1 PA2778 family cysteine peptidase [Desulfobulbaceae bacterium]